MSPNEIFDMIKTFNWGFWDYISLLRKIQFFLIGEYIVWYIFVFVIVIGLPFLHLYYVRPEFKRRMEYYKRKRQETDRQRALSEYRKRGIQ